MKKFYKKRFYLFDALYQYITNYFKIYSKKILQYLQHFYNYSVKDSTNSSIKYKQLKFTAMKTYKTILTSNYTNRENAIDSDSAPQLANELETMLQYLECDMRENSKDNKGDKNFSFCWQLQYEGKKLCDFSVCYYKDNKNWYMTFKINGCEITSMGMRTEMTANLCGFIKSNKLRLGIYVSNIATKEHFK